jgi:DNA-binding MarR family transcriptional regulator
MTLQRDESLAPLRARGGGQTGESGGSSARTKQGSSRSTAGRHYDRDHVHEGYLIKELQHRLRKRIEARIRAKGLWLSFPHSTVLMTLNEEPGLSGAQLARRNSVTAQTMNGLLQPLEAKGLIERRSDPENARILKCYLKPKGSQLLQQGMHEARSVFDLMLGKLTTRERAEFRRILQRCIAALHGDKQDDRSSEGEQKRKAKGQ